jgi:GT2 family glycosyltransferase
VIDAVMESRRFDPATSLGEVLVADNASTTATKSVVDQWNKRRREQNEAMSSEVNIETAATPVRFVRFASNLGYAGGTNAALRHLDQECDAVFLLNPDAIVAPTAIALCAQSLTQQPSTVLSVAPKMMLREHGRFIDAVGNCINGRGEAANVGLGQPDIGQFDEPTKIFGPCFGAALFRRIAFRDSHVGPLDDRLFLYYEDVDWNCRAQLLGYESVTEPHAIVAHQMSGSTRHLAYDFKFHLTERNLLLTVLKCFSWKRVASIWFARGTGLVLGSLKGHYPRAGLKALFGAALRIPSTLQLRRELQKRRARTDSAVIEYSANNRTFFDAQRYAPINEAEATAFANALLH